MQNKSMQKFRLLVLVLIAILIVSAFATRSGSPLIPAFVEEYGGDTLWALMVYLVVRFIVPHWSPLKSALLTLLIALLGEISQLYHAPWIDTIRSYRLGGVILGYGFLWSDLICYTIGILIGAFSEWALRKAFSGKGIGD